jgi:hypothetical protein
LRHPRLPRRISIQIPIVAPPMVPLRLHVPSSAAYPAYRGRVRLPHGRLLQCLRSSHSNAAHATRPLVPGRTDSRYIRPRVLYGATARQVDLGRLCSASGCETAHRVPQSQHPCSWYYCQASFSCQKGWEMAAAAPPKRLDHVPQPDTWRCEGPRKPPELTDHILGRVAS